MVRPRRPARRRSLKQWCASTLCSLARRGGFAQKKGKSISRTRHCVIEAAHPSPLSVTKFRGCKVFSQANAFLEKKGCARIDWSLPA